MSGHSKWSTIKRKKGSEDAKRGQLFTKLARDITVSVRSGGGDVSSNSALRSAIDKARSMNMPKINIERAIARGAGMGFDGITVSEAIYEGYGSGGVAILVKCLTDNKNRTVSEIRSVFSRGGGSLGEAGSVVYIFSSSDMVPTFKVHLSQEDLKRFNTLYEELESLDDVVGIYSNADLT